MVRRSWQFWKREASGPTAAPAAEGLQAASALGPSEVSGEGSTATAEAVEVAEPAASPDATQLDEAVAAPDSMPLADARATTDDAVRAGTVTCAFCRGLGRDPFGVMSWSSTCHACHGSRHRRVPGRAAPCVYCRGTGVSPLGARTYCAACHGAGALTVPQGPLGTCPECGGDGASGGGLYCLRCRGAGQIGAWL